MTIPTVKRTVAVTCRYKGYDGRIDDVLRAFFEDELGAEEVGSGHNFMTGMRDITFDMPVEVSGLEPEDDDYGPEVAGDA